MKQPVYTEQVGLSTAEVYQYRGIYSVLLMGDRVVCFLGNSTSLEDCKEEIKHLKKLAKEFAMG